MKKKIFLFAALFAFLFPPTSSAIRPSPNIQVQNLDVLIVIYRKSHKRGRIGDKQLEIMKNSFEEAREFYFRNSKGRLNLKLNYAIYDRHLPKMIKKKYTSIENHLRQQGIKDNQYDMVYTTNGDLPGNYGGYVILGKTGAAYGWGWSRRDLRKDYPKFDLKISAQCMWIFLHESQHALDIAICRLSGRPEMLHAHPYADRKRKYFKGNYPGGKRYSWIATTLRHYDGYLHLKPPHSHLKNYKDSDGDGLADSAPDLPIDEKRFGSDPKKYDTDRDGLSDFEEYIASIYEGSNPRVPDTDYDGVIDGQDRYPLVPLARELAKLPQMPTPQSLEPSHLKNILPYPYTASVKAWRSKTNDQIQVRGGWTKEGLYFFASAPKPFHLQLILDGNPKSGFWAGGQTYPIEVKWRKKKPRLKNLGGNVRIPFPGPIPGSWSKKFRWKAKGKRYYGKVFFIPCKLGQGFSWERDRKKKWNLKPRNREKGIELKAGQEISLNILLQNVGKNKEVIAFTPHWELYRIRLGK